MRSERGQADLPPGPVRELADLFRRLRRQRPLSVGQIAVATSLSPSHVSEVLRGWKTPSPQAADAIARALGAGAEEAAKAHRMAEQVQELKRYLRTHSAPPGAGRQPWTWHSLPVPAGDGHGHLARLTRSGAAGDEDLGSAACYEPVVEVFPVAIGHYTDPGMADLGGVEARVGRLVDLLAVFGGRHRPWAQPARERGASAVQRRLRDWSRPPAAATDTGRRAGLGLSPPPGSVLYWVGHGWSDGFRAVLAHAESPATVGGWGLEPQQLAQAIRARQAAIPAGWQGAGAGGWALVVLDTSHATQVADAVMAALHGPDAPGRLLLVAVPHDDAAPAAGFGDVLAALLASTYRAERQILLRDLASQLERVLGPGNVYQRGLGEAALVRTYPPVASWMSAPVDTIRHLEEVLASLPADERSHFVGKAQGAEQGELCWFFEGRQQEAGQISTWLHQALSGMLVVTGRAGSGKSALLGSVLVHSLPGLRDALARRGLITMPGPASLPPDGVFDAVIHLSGLTLQQATGRVAAAAGLGRLPSQTDSALGVANDLDWLTDRLPAMLEGRGRPLTILADALDEAIDPLDTARALLARLAALPQVRVLVGTRASTSETPDTPAGDNDLLRALSADLPSPGAQGGPGLVRVGRDSQAISRYAARRLRHARDYGLGGGAIPAMTHVRDADIDRAAGAIAARDREFLFARLAVYELIEDPTFLLPGRAASLDQLLRGDHQDLFAKALDRLARLDDHYEPLIQALALARGRGIPEADGIWATIAAAFTTTPGHPRPPGDPSTNGLAPRAWARAIQGLLSHAAAYLVVDTADEGQRATVYRLAHRTFVEYFTRTRQASTAHRDRQRHAAKALLDRARQIAAADPGGMPAYLARHLTGHIGDARLWDSLAATPRVLDGLHPAAVTTDALRTLFGRRAIPAPIAGIIGARDDLLTASPADRAACGNSPAPPIAPGAFPASLATSGGSQPLRPGRSVCTSGSPATPLPSPVCASCRCPAGAPRSPPPATMAPSGCGTLRLVRPSEHR